MARRVALAAALLLASTATPAAASVGHLLPHLGPVPLSKPSGPRGFAVPKGYASTNMTFHGGSVMHSNTVHAIYWQGSGSSHPFPANYRTTIDAFLANVAADSGTRGNVYSTDIQYYDNNGHVQYKSTFAGSLVDPTAYPLIGCTPTPPTDYDVCLTDDQLANELDSFIAAHPSLNRGLGDIYMLFLPPKVQTCTNPTPTDCFGITYCAYHSGFLETNGSAPVTLFANLPFSAGVSNGGCDVGVHPNDANADPTIDVTSHEHNETITDPIGDGWYQDNAPPGGGENGDLCNTYYGPNQSGFNQTINGTHYYLQGEWSNLDSGCALSLANRAPMPRISVSSTRIQSLNTVNFNGSKSGDPDGTIETYRWHFGDGKAATGKTTSHSYRTPGTRIATLTVTDNDGLATTAKVTIVVTNRKPVAVIGLPSNPRAGRGAKFRGGHSHDHDGRVVAWRWHFGDHTHAATGHAPRHTYARGGNYRVSLTVTDDHGKRSTARATVTVARR